MSILSDFEDRVASAVEGLFAGAFRSPVQPAELAKALAKAMDDERMVGRRQGLRAGRPTRSRSRPRTPSNLRGFVRYWPANWRPSSPSAPARAATTCGPAQGDTSIEHADLRLGRFRVSAEHVSPPSRQSRRTSRSRRRRAPHRRPRRPQPHQSTGTRRRRWRCPAVPGPSARSGSHAHIGTTTSRSRPPAHGHRPPPGVRHMPRRRERIAPARRTRPDGDDWRVEDLGSTNGTLVNGGSA